MIRKKPPEETPGAFCHLAWIAPGDFVPGQPGDGGLYDNGPAEDYYLAFPLGASGTPYSGPVFFDSFNLSGPPEVCGAPGIHCCASATLPPMGTGGS